MRFIIVICVFSLGALCQASDLSCECEKNVSVHSCECSGDSLHEVPRNLKQGVVSRLSLTKGKLTEIFPDSISNYKQHLTDLSISIMPNLREIHPNVFSNLPQIKYLKVVRTGLLKLPQLNGLGLKGQMTAIDFENNKINIIESNNVHVRVEQLFLNYNEIQSVRGWAFNGSEIGKLSFHGNRNLRHLSNNAFSGIKSLRDLDLSDTSITYLPVSGLEELETLKLINTYTLKTIPSIYDLKKYLEETKSCSEGSDRSKRHSDSGFGEIYHESDYNGSAPDSHGYDLGLGVFHESTASINPFKEVSACGNITKRSPVKCYPLPDELNPCEDMMSWIWLRASVWVVLLTAIVGNISVLFVLSFSRSEKSVPKFLMLHLAFPDLCMAIYLLLLASMDLVSSTTYFNYAFDWQNGVGCKVAGFLTVFASQLSLFTLCLLTLERWCAIKHALHSNRLDHYLARKIIIIGWAYSIIMGALPLIGVSSYSRTSICLPMDTHDIKSVIYVVLLLVTAAISFILICTCYAQIYLSLSYETRTSKEGSVAKKMTILVGTNFICWAPIAFFATTALLGYPLINVSQSKIVLVFIYPINSCANPYLYAILTKQFRKDLVTLLTRFGLCNRCGKSYKSVHSSPITNELHQTPLTADTGL